MPVIIDDFEVLVAPSSATPEPAEESTSPPPQSFTPRDIQDVIEAMHEREARLRAH